MSCQNVVSDDLVTTCRVVSYNHVTTSRVISYDLVTTTRVISYNVITTLTYDSTSIMFPSVHRLLKLLNCVALHLALVESVPDSTTHQKNRYTILAHHENFRCPTHLGLPHQNGSSYHRSSNTDLTMTSPPAIQPLG